MIVTRISWRSYKFKPQILTEGEFHTLKEHLTANPEMTLNFKFALPSIRKEIWKEFQIDLFTSLVMTLISLILLLIFGNMSSESLGFFGVILSIICLASAYQILSVIVSFITYLGFIYDRARFPSRLKKAVIKNKTYKQYLYTQPVIVKVKPKS